MQFTNINVKSHYSLLNSSLKINDIINFALNNDFKYVSLCDQNYFSGGLEFIFSAKKNNLIPIIGLEITLKKDDYLIKYCAFSINYLGYKNLEKLSSCALSNNELSINEEEFNKYNDGLVFVVDVLSSNIYQNYLLNDEIDNNDIKILNELFNNEYFYFIENDDDFKQLFIKASNNEKYIIASSKHYLHKEEHDLYLMLNAIKESRIVEKGLLNQSGNLYLKTYDEIKNEYKSNEIINTEKFLRLFNNYELKLDYTLPLYKKNEYEVNEYLKSLSYKGLLKRLHNNVSDIYKTRLIYELDVVRKMGYSNYFLIVYDYVLYAKKNDILVGPGRGSSAGSLIAYTLGITEVDPIKNSLLFERFLNPERLSLPDIDVDFQDDKRDEIIEYLKNKYGSENIGHIATFGTFQAKNTIRDLGRVLDYPNYQIEQILKLMPIEDKRSKIRLESVLNNSNQLQILLNSNEDLKYIYHKAILLEDVNRHISTHAAGIIIANKELVNYAPIIKGINDTLMIQYSMDYIEEIGLYKMDILGLKNLSILSNILKRINDDVKLSEININDKKTLDLVSKGQTLGIFQFESDGVIKVLKKMKVDTIDDMVATTALFRPGPMKYIDEYISRKNNIKAFSYLHDDLKPILSSTYGIIVYQEQIMQICQVMAGFSLAKADIVRKGMAKKDKKLLEDIKIEFVNASLEKGYNIDVVNKVYEMILLFSDYGFNKAHAYSYALLGYYLAYLKVNYPIAFYESILSANTYNIQKLKQYFYEMKQLNLKISNPNINISNFDYVYENNEFIMPLLSIKGLGDSNTTNIINERILNKEYSDYINCVVRLIKAKIGIKIIESLIYSGAFDSFEYNRNTMIENLEKVVNYAQLISVDDKQYTLEIDFIPKPKIIKYKEEYDIIAKELEYLGLYVAKHPLDIYENKYDSLTINNFNVNKQALVYIDFIKEIRTKKGELMAFINASDQVDNISLVLFPIVYSRLKVLLSNKKAILVRGKLDEKDSNNIIVSEIEVL